MYIFIIIIIIINIYPPNLHTLLFNPQPAALILVL